MSADLFEAVWSALPTALIVIDGDDGIKLLNSAAENLVGSSSKSLRGRRLSEFVGEASLVADTVQQAREKPFSIVQHDVEIGWQDQSFRLGTLQAAQLAGEEGDVLLLLNPRGLAEKMDRSLGYRTAARSVTGMAAMLAHEIRNPLAGITGAAQLLSMSLDEADHELTTLIEQEAKRIGSLVERVEQFGDIRRAERQAVNIHDVLHRAVSAAKAGFAAHARVREEYDPSLPPTAADPDQLLQVFQNLLKNAGEAIPSVGGTITIKTAYKPGIKLSLPGGQGAGLPLEVCIVDNGPGIGPELKEHIFDPFVSSKVNGSGLGLSLVSKVLTDHGGVVECESQPGRTEFRIMLPVWIEPTASPLEQGT